jgi:vibriolysin
VVSNRAIVRFSSLLILVVICMFYWGCSTDNSVNPYYQVEKTGTVVTKTYWDASHQVRIQVYEAQAPVANHHSGFVVNVGADEVCVGGGADACGGYLTESRPLADLSGWSVGDKDHIISKIRPLSVNAIGLALFDINGNQISRNVLLQYISLFSQTSTSAPHPSLAVSVPNNMKLIGGGAKVNWSGWGNMLVKSYPLSSNAWCAESKDHVYSSPATITVYAIGINPNIPIFGTLDIQTISAYVSAWKDNSTSVVLRDYPTGYVLACLGANATSEGFGMMLTTMWSNYSTVCTISNSCFYADRGNLTAFGLVIKKL